MTNTTTQSATGADLKGLSTDRTSWLFRDLEFELSDLITVIKEEITAGKYDTANVASIGCATGEEVYSVAAMLAHEGIKGVVNGYDNLQRNINFASNGLYRFGFLTAIEKEGGEVRKYLDLFDTELDGYSYFLKDRSMVGFSLHDIVKSPIAQKPIVLCRNTLFHYKENPELFEQFYDHLSASVAEDGLLVLDRKSVNRIQEHETVRTKFERDYSVVKESTTGYVLRKTSK